MRSTQLFGWIAPFPLCASFSLSARLPTPSNLNQLSLQTTAATTCQAAAASAFEMTQDTSPLIPEQEQDLEDLDDAFVQSQWLMPMVVERALIHQDDSVDPYELLDRLDMSNADRSKALEALETCKESSQLVQTALGALTPQECGKIRKFLHKRIENDGIDNVDGCPDWQVNVTPKKLAKIIGKSAVDRLLDIPKKSFSSFQDDDDSSSLFDYERIGIFIRMYQRSKRPWMPFHRDGNRWTLNIALNDDVEYKGGRLLALYNGKVHVVQGRGEGDATCHAGCVQHGVSSMQQGTRYSMILFFHTRDGHA